MGDENENGIPDFFEDMDNWGILLDTDGEGLPDSIEEYLGTDSTLLDTDGDGLPDYYELFSTYTSPLLYDTEEGKQKGPVDGHYVTVTGVIDDKIEGKTYLEIYSWGKKNYIDVDEYFYSVDKYSNYIFSNIIYIK